MVEEVSSKQVETIVGQSDSARQRSSIHFPYNHLDDALAVVRAMWDKQGSAACTVDQLAAWTGHSTVNSGTFRNKLQATRYFGLIDVKSQQVSLTRLGEEIVEPEHERAARVKAFLSVPLYKKIFDRYRGRQLPPAVGLENEMKALGVAPKQARKARQVFARSAAQAGFFASGAERLVQPADTQVSATVTLPFESLQGVSSHGSGGPPRSTNLHTKIRLLLNVLPPIGDAWPEEDQEEWLDLIRGALRTIYPTEEQQEQTE